MTMNNSFDSNETIELALPLNGAYVSAARLTVASVANRLGFDVDEIEDLKAALSEACIYIIKKSPTDFRGTFHIAFLVKPSLLEIKISTDIPIKFNEVDDEMGLFMIKALMDNVEITAQDENRTQIIMRKDHKQTTF